MMKMKKWFMGLMLVVLVLACAVQYSNSGTVLGSNSGNEICKDSAYRDQLQRWLEGAERDLVFAQDQFNWALEHDTGVFSAQLLLQQAQRYVFECKRRLDEYDSRTMNG